VTAYTAWSIFISSAVFSTVLALSAKLPRATRIRNAKFGVAFVGVMALGALFILLSTS